MTTADLRSAAASASPLSRAAMLAALDEKPPAAKVKTTELWHLCTFSSSVDQRRVFVPIKTVNPLNGRQHWRIVSKRGKSEKNLTASHLATAGSLPLLPVTVTMIRHGRGTRPMDSDGLTASLKHVRDSVAMCYGVDDGDTRKIRFLEPRQLTKQPKARVEILIEQAERTAE